MNADQLLVDISKAEAKADRHMAKSVEAEQAAIALEEQLCATLRKSRVKGVIHLDIDSQTYHVHYLGTHGLECIPVCFSDQLEIAPTPPATDREKTNGKIAGHVLSALFSGSFPANTRS